MRRSNPSDNPSPQMETIAAGRHILYGRVLRAPLGFVREIDPRQETVLQSRSGSNGIALSDSGRQAIGLHALTSSTPFKSEAPRPPLGRHRRGPSPNAGRAP